eukprot:6195890-Pleurochrysis_carterae.AAC.1
MNDNPSKPPCSQDRVELSGKSRESTKIAHKRAFKAIASEYVHVHLRARICKRARARARGQVFSHTRSTSLSPSGGKDAYGCACARVSVKVLRAKLYLRACAFKYVKRFVGSRAFIRLQLSSQA